MLGCGHGDGRGLGVSARRSNAGRHGPSAPSREQVAIGRRAVAEAIRAGRAAEVLAQQDARSTQGMRALVREAERSRVPIRWVGRGEIERLGPREHQGVAAVLAPSRELDERDLTSMSLASDALVVVLDGIVDPQNLGACARAAEAAGAAALVARTRRAAPVTPAAIRASAGALMHLPFVRVPNLSRALGHLKSRSFFVVGLDERAEVAIYEALPPPRPLALIVGSEEKGVSRLVRETCDLLVSIPMRGRTSSLNASAALAVALFAYVQRPVDPAGGKPVDTIPPRWRGAVR